MNDAKQQRIQQLSNVVAEKKLHLMNLGMMNVWGVEPAERLRRSAEYSQAQAALWNAESDLRSAMGSIDP